MVHRFPTFQIDESLRELRTGGTTVKLQPRVFDLLVYLVRHGDRVVPKDELLDSVWPGVIVADGSLQRAISLARHALASAGAPDAIHTFARHGYRFHAPGAELGASCDLTDFAGLHRRMFGMHFAGESEEALDELETAVADERARGDSRAAAWACIIIGLLRLERREMVLARGWHRHAERLLEDADASREKGYADFLGLRIALFENDPTRSLALAERARAAGARRGDATLEGLGLLGIGEANLMLGRTREGLDALDEAGAAVVSGGMGTWATGLVYCGMIYCCMSRSDWTRASQWTDQFNRWGKNKGRLAYPGLCRLHRAEVLAVRGELTLALKEIDALHEELARTSPWVEGEVWRALGDIQTAKGDFVAAESAYAQAAAIGSDTRFELALLRLHDGHPAEAAEMIRGLLDERAWSCQAKLGRAWANLAIASARGGDCTAARIILEKLAAEPELVSTPALEALTLAARAELELAEGRSMAAVGLLRSAIAILLEMAAPLAAAEARGRLARILLEVNEEGLAEMELKAAREGFLPAGADPAFERCKRYYESAKRAD